MRVQLEVGHTLCTLVHIMSRIAKITDFRVALVDRTGPDTGKSQPDPDAIDKGVPACARLASLFGVGCSEVLPLVSTSNSDKKTWLYVLALA